jgi:hypothetical protein
MIRLTAFLLLIPLIDCSAATAARPDKPNKAQEEPTDLQGRPLPWGPEVNGARLSVRLVRNRLLYGEPIEFLVDTLNPCGSRKHCLVVEQGLTTSASDMIVVPWPLVSTGPK